MGDGRKRGRRLSVVLMCVCHANHVSAAIVPEHTVGFEDNFGQRMNDV